MKPQGFLPWKQVSMPSETQPTAHVAIDFVNPRSPDSPLRDESSHCVRSTGVPRSYHPLATRAFWLVLCLFLAAGTLSAESAAIAADRILLPIEALGANGLVASRTFALPPEQVDSVRFLWLRVHRLKYAEQGSVQLNTGPWLPLNNDTVTVAEPGKSFGGIGGGFSTLVMTLPLPSRSVAAGVNTIRFRFNQTDGLSSGYRVLELNFTTADGRKLLPPDAFADDTPANWAAPLPDAPSIQAGRELWHTASLVANSLPGSPKFQAHCADCHAQDGRDLKYFNYSNLSIIARSVFHGLSAQQGEQIASYIRSLPLPNPGRPWNPPYQPGPGLEEQPVSNWAAGAGLRWVLDRDTDALPYLLEPRGVQPNSADSEPPTNVPDLRQLLNQITADVFRPDGNLSPRDVPIALQLPDWSDWLPRVHPKDAWGPAFTQSEFAALYDEQAGRESKSKRTAKSSLRALLATSKAPDSNLHPIVAAFTQWSQARSNFLKDSVKPKTNWSPDLTNKVYSTQLWQLVKTWEVMQESALEGRGRDLFGLTADALTWCNTIPKQSAPAEVHIPDGAAGVGGSALTNEYFNSSWYELQILLNSGNHQHQDRAPLDWVYVIGRFQDLYRQTHQPEPARLLVAVTKAMQSTDPRIGPADYRHGWRPEQNIDPRIMISPDWAPIFQPLPPEVRRAFTTSLLAAWMDKNLQYPLAKFLPLQGGNPPSYAPSPGYHSGVTGGKVWEAAKQFREAGVSPDLVSRLELWGMAYTDRSARIQYH
jgi:hypothetical protein